MGSRHPPVVVYADRVRIFTVPTFGDVHFLDAAHLAGWNYIASHPSARTELWLPEFSEETLEEDGLRNPDWRAAVRETSAERRELVVIDYINRVTVAAVIGCYSCDSAGTEFGVLVELAVEPSCRGSGLGTAFTRELGVWIDSEVPGAHAFADVCTQNARSQGMVRSAGWRPVFTDYCGPESHGLHQCRRQATRYCSSSSHRT